MVLSFCYGVAKQTQSGQWTWAMDPSSQASSFQKLPFAKWQTAWLATTKAFRGRMNRGLSQERLVEMRPFCFYPSREAEWSRAGFFALAVHFKWSVERRGVYLCCFINCVFIPDLASVGVLLQVWALPGHPFHPLLLLYLHSPAAPCLLTYLNPL